MISLTPELLQKLKPYWKNHPHETPGKANISLMEARDILQEIGLPVSKTTFENTYEERTYLGATKNTSSVHFLEVETAGYPMANNIASYSMLTKTLAIHVWKDSTFVGRRFAPQMADRIVTPDGVIKP